MIFIEKEGVFACYTWLIFGMASLTDVQKEGFLVKKGHVRHNWRTRWFVLLKHELVYFRTKGDKIPAGIVPLNGATLFCPPQDTSKKPWLLNLTTYDNRQYMIQTPDRSARDEWKGLIEDCIRKLDPAKFNKEMSPTRTLSRTEAFDSTYSNFRDIVQAMQDVHAGVKLMQFKQRGSSSSLHNIKYFFTGKDAIDWLIGWSFAEDRASACVLASKIIQYGFFNAVHLDMKENVYEKMRDSLLVKEVVDSQEAYYDFVVFAPAESMHLFASDTGEGDESGSDSDSEDDILSARAIGVNATHTGSVQDNMILKQGFLLKKRRKRQVWKARKFVLKKKDPSLLYYKGSKGNRALGGIPLKDLTIIDKDVESDDKNDTCPLPHMNSCLATPTSTLPLNIQYSQTSYRIVLLTATGNRYELEAYDSNDRDSWSSMIRLASKLCS